ncbi:MAG: enoyl-CoA hydratase/isomerase family protein [Gemmatales bacterium]
MIERSQNEGILTLRLAHGKVNALDLELLDALLGELNGTTDDIRALILTGTGSIFSSGVDLVRLTREGANYVKQFLPLFSRFLRTLFAFPKPVIVAVNGHAIAGGCLIAQAADMRLMATGPGKIGVPELLVGVPLAGIALEIVRFATPREKLQSLIYTGRIFSAQEALGAGLVDEAVAPEDLEARAQELAQQLAMIPSMAYRLTKQSLRAEALERIDHAGKQADQMMLELWSSPQTHAHLLDYLRRAKGK